MSFSLLCLGCGNGSPQGKTIDVQGDNENSDVAEVFDVTDAEVIDTGDADAPPDKVQEDSNATVDKDFGDPCEENLDCESTYCIAASNGKKCTSTCVEECPKGWSCEEIDQGGSDLTFICMPTKTDLCASCLGDSECSTGLDTSCEVLKDEGQFCTRTCHADAPCPSGYACKTSETNDDNFCYPTGGSCICFGPLLGAEEPCYNKSVFGTCYGLEKCSGPGGWSECDAKVPSQEICDGKDNDCDEQIDDGTDGAPCENASEFGTCTGVKECQGLSGLKCSAAIPGPEVCGDNIDNDCNGKTDEIDADGCTVFYEDIDNDDYGASNSSACLCEPTGHFTAVIGGDCNDLAALVHPDGNETCNGKDDNCDDIIDPQDSQQCIVYFLDNDSDGFGDGTKSGCFCKPTGKYVSQTAGDCDDTKVLVYPGASEICNGDDDNCNSLVDEVGAQGCQPYLLDDDDDTYGVTGLFLCQCAPSDPFDALKSGDCDDSDPLLHPGADDNCDNVDNNCNGLKDEGCDEDNDGFCTLQKPVEGNPDECPLGPGDCNDFDPNINPQSDEVCDNKDNNCKDGTDEGVTSPCGGCTPVCLMAAGQQGDPMNGPKSNTQANGDGFIILAGGNQGTYRHTFEGWESGHTQWMQAGLSMEQTDNTWVKLRVRTANDLAGLDNAGWTSWFGKFPPATLPVNLGSSNKIIGRYLMIEVQLNKSSGASPILKGIDIVAAEYK